MRDRLAGWIGRLSRNGSDQDTLTSSDPVTSSGGNAILQRLALLAGRPTLSVALAVSLLVFAISYFPRFWGHDIGEYYWWDHGEGVSLTTIGRWGSPFVDGMSGEFPILYQYVSDWLINVAANFFGSPPFSLQVLYGCVLAGAIVVLNFAFLRRFLNASTAALAAAILIALMADPILVDSLYPIAGAPDYPGWVDMVMHVPAGSISLGTGQGLAYFLFLPALICAYFAIAEARLVWAALAGALFGVMLQTNFLTLIGLATAAGAGIWFVASLDDWRDGRKTSFAARVAGVIGTVVALLLLAQGNVKLHHLVILWTVLFAAGLVSLRAISALAVMAGAATCVASPMLLHFWRNRDALASLNAPVDAPMQLLVTAIFFAPAWIAAAMILRHPAVGAMARQLAYLFGAIAALLALSQGQLWGFSNHQYRFAILLVFPLSVILSVALFAPWQGARRVIATALALVVSVSVLRNVTVMLGAPRDGPLGLFYYYPIVDVADEKTTGLLRALGAATRDLDPGERILMPPEFSYPTGVRDAAIMAAVSARPAFLPDYRYILDREAYRDRLAVFCFLFPEFPHFDQHTQTRACEKPPVLADDEAHLSNFVTDEAKANVLDLYGIALVADRNSPFGDIVRQRWSAYGLAPLYDDRSLLIRREDRGGDVRIGRGVWTKDRWEIPLRVQKPGNYQITILGRDLKTKFSHVKLNGAEDQILKLEDTYISGLAKIIGNQATMALHVCRGSFFEAPSERTPIFYISATPIEAELADYAGFATSSNACKPRASLQ